MFDEGEEELIFELSTHCCTLYSVYMLQKHILHSQSRHSITLITILTGCKFPFSARRQPTMTHPKKKAQTALTRPRMTK